jgi:hypothetical protein
VRGRATLVGVWQVVDGVVVVMLDYAMLDEAVGDGWDAERRFG